MSKRLLEEEFIGDAEEDVEVCANCGGLMSEEDGIEYCPSCDTQVDFFGDHDEEF